MGKSFTILHLSDLHIGHPDRTVDIKQVTQPLFRDIKYMKKKYGLNPRLIVFSGDLAFGNIPRKSPLSNQYREAKSFIDSIYEALGTTFDKTKFIIVPGNHDIKRECVKDKQIKWINSLAEQDNNYLSSQIQNHRPEWVSVSKSQNLWTEFIKEFYKDHWNFDDDTRMSWGIISYDRKRIGVVGLNSSWASYDSDKDKGNLRISEYQLLRAKEKVEDCDFRIVVMHHPYGWLHVNEQSFIKQRIQTNFHILYHGHEHDEWFEDQNKHLAVAAGACYQGSKRDNCYSWTSIDFSNKSAMLYLRKFTLGGSGGWCPLVIPDKTDNTEGIARINNLFNGHENHRPCMKGANNKNKKCPPGAPCALTSDHPFNEVVDINNLIKIFDDRFGFRWEPESFGNSSGNPVIYWPIRLRKPTPIHAVQSFIAAALQQKGSTIYLFLDDLGKQDFPPVDFVKKIGKWFKSVGGDISRLTINIFSAVLSSEGSVIDPWDTIKRWLGDSNYKLDDVLKVTKLLPQSSSGESVLDILLSKKPRKLLTPALVWACLFYLSKIIPNTPIITLGGFDEQPLWKTWRECIGHNGLSIGHLYGTELIDSNYGESQHAIHMEKKDLSWSSTKDIKRALQEAYNTHSSNLEGIFKEGAIISWSLVSCIFLPRYINGDKEEIKIGQTVINDCKDLIGLDKDNVIDMLTQELGRWLLK